MTPCYNIMFTTEKLSEPMPWIGVYIAAASSICSLAMGADLVRGFRSRKLWIPCKFFTLNAASLTVLAVVVKLPMDLNNPMPGLYDQLSKLSSVAFMATSMANFMPSLGVMDSKDVLMNMTALGIFVITLLVNVSIQLYTGLIFLCTGEHVMVICSTLFLFWNMSWSALVAPTTKKILERKYQEIGKTIISAESVEGGGDIGFGKLKEDVRKYWLMAESSNPQFVMVRLPICFASSAICCLNCLILCLALFGSFSFQTGCAFVPHTSDYGVTTYFIVMIQLSGVIIGTLTSLFRCFVAVKIRCSKGGGCAGGLRPEKYWTERLMEWIERPLPLQLGGRYFIKAINRSKDIILCFCVIVQIVTVFICKLELLLFVFIRLLLSCSICYKVDCSRDPDDVSCYVLHLEGEDHLPQVMAKNKNPLSNFIEKGIKQQPRVLAKFLQKMTTNFYGVAKFDTSQVQPLHSEELPNCWKLPIIALTGIAIALPRIPGEAVENLRFSVSQGLKYISIVDEVLGNGRPFKKVRNAADEAWSDVYLSGRFLNKDLRQMAREGHPSREILEKLCNIAQDYVKENESLASDCSLWPNKVMAANSMYRISQSILLQLESKDELSNEELFELISIMIADILGACLTNLPKAITTKCSSVSIEKCVKTVQEMAHIIGETEEILKMLQEHQLLDLAPDKRIDIDEWCRLLVGMSPQVFSSLPSTNRDFNSLPSTNKDSTSSLETQIIIES